MTDGNRTDGGPADGNHTGGPVETVGRPTTREAMAALLAAGLCAGAVAGTPTDRLAVVVSLVGWAVVLLADRVGGRGWPRLGRLTTGVAVVVLLGAFGTLTPEGRTLELLPDVVVLVGVALVALGGLPLRRGWGRPLVAWGGVALVAAVFAETVVLPVRPLAFFVGLAAALVAWDLGEQAVSLGEQVGRRGATTAVYRSHAVGSVAAAGVGVVVALGATTLGSVPVPAGVLAACVCACVVLLVALYS
ncbi:DUF7519 family protein [Halomarina oriensis]|uniref:Uncharacterized protein n=1 Tax=Halomarina oriensis TaxID=671145 RepID=A0A6B0GVB2_9EURY|nr:hypothetical protein [Halomarina oriensis]MWG36075.1 hypothetical protein [Halomarina oriensis]